VFVVTRETRERGTYPQSSQIHRNVSRTTGAVVNLINIDNGHWGLWTHSRCAAMPESIQHDIANDEDLSLSKIRDISHELFLFPYPPAEAV
jgi:hypothetical protein